MALLEFHIPPFVSFNPPGFRVGDGPLVPALRNPLAPSLTPDFMEIVKRYPESAALAETFNQRISYTYVAVLFSGLALAVGVLGYMWLGWIPYILCGVICVLFAATLNYRAYTCFRRMIEAYDRGRAADGDMDVFERHIITNEGCFEQF